jgi:hypothetical protein
VLVYVVASVPIILLIIYITIVICDIFSIKCSRCNRVSGIPGLAYYYYCPIFDKYSLKPDFNIPPFIRLFCFRAKLKKRGFK